MAPETRSRGVPPSSRVYNSSPSLQQVQFPARRKKIRRYGGSERPSLKQQTLTQIDFVSGFGEDVIILSDSDDDIQDEDVGSEDKENMKPSLPNGQDQNAQEEEEKGKEEAEDDEEPVSIRRKRAAPSIKQSKKRRRTMGDESKKAITPRKEDKSRRKTLDDMPTRSNYHTQTLTQFLGHQTSFVADSDDDLDLDKDDGDDGFLSWLGEPGSPSTGRGKRDFSSPAMKRRHEATAAMTASTADVGMSREDSIIPQTPAKKNTAIRFDLPSGGLQSPSQRMVKRYGAPDQQDSPLKNHTSPMKPPLVKLTGEPRRVSPGVTRRSSLVIQDSYTTDGCITPSKNQAKVSQSKTPTPLRVLFDTPSILNPVGDDDTPTKRRRPRRKSPSPKKLAAKGVLHEIPDSDGEDDGFGEEDEDDGKNLDERYGVGVETQLVLNELVSTEESQHSWHDAVPCSPPTSRMHTQAEPVSATVQYEQQSTANQPIHASSTSSRPTTPLRPKPVRKPLPHLSVHTQIQSQPFESQRVHVSILQSLPAPSARSDILLPVSTASLEGLITGTTVHVTTSFKIPSQVVRFWLFENGLLRYMASVEPGQQDPPASFSSSSQGRWQFHTTQVYELNNPVCEDDMRQEGWLRGQIARYKYLPPAVIGQLLWNLRHALFADEPSEQQVASSPVHPSSQPKLPQGDDEDRARNCPPSSTPPGSMTVSQQITAQIHSDIASSTQLPTSDDMVPSTPDFNEPLKLRSSSRTTTLPTPSAPKQPSRTVRPSQATTLSQPSTPEKQTQQPASMPPPPPPPLNPSQSSVQFAESSYLSSLPIPSSLGSTSQLLTKSQMLPDSLIQDHAPPVQPEIWDSDEEDASL